MPCGPVTC